MPSQTSIVYFDGTCGLCSRIVDFLIRRDSARRLRFAPLQGETSRRNLSQQDREIRESVVLTWGSKTYRHSAAVVRILWQLRGAWKPLAAALWMVPRPLRDWGYRFVARHRFGVFGKSEICRLPSPEESLQLLP